jgi:hypothetical protein
MLGKNQTKDTNIGVYNQTNQSVGEWLLIIIQKSISEWLASQFSAARMHVVLSRYMYHNIYH